ncbi:DUF2130 domain-containing protein [Candidatus Daviesbacteria bacterium]|nr:DUF2130 domain-containing protein [Candidatus Daviesbacteria bacterium]
MDTNPTTTILVCPNCKKQISIDEALRSRLEGQIKNNLRNEFNQKWVEEKKKLEENLQGQIDEKTKKEKLELEKRLEKQKKEIDTFRENELTLRRKTQEMEEKEKNLELEKQRQIDEERKKIQEKTAEEFMEKFHLKEKEHEQQMEAMKKSLDEAQRKASQGSQQLQGEVLELELEGILKQEFPADEIIPVPKGVTGADVIQKIKDLNGRDCGIIIWESKRTKNWTEGWIQKLKDDQRATKADVAIIVSSILPEGVKNFVTKDGIHITSFDAFISLAKLVRSSLVDLQKTKLSTVDKSNKMEIVYTYLSGIEFRQRFEAIIEAFTGMKGDLEKEKLLYIKVWAKREKQIQKVVGNTAGMYGDLQGLMGASLPEIKLLDVDVELLESPEE